MERSFSMGRGGSSSNDQEALWMTTTALRSYAYSFSSSSLSSSSSSSSLLVLDSVRGELVEAPAQLFERNKKAAAAVAAERSLEALKNHSEAERRRRARINAHFDTLRRLLPEATKMDKASLLGQVVYHLRDLKRKAAKASEEHNTIPKDTDEVKVEQEEDSTNNSNESNDNSCSMRVSVSCDYRPGLLSDLRRAIDGADLITTSAEISTLGCRMKNVFVVTVQAGDGFQDEARRRFRARSICQALRSVVENDGSSSDEFLRSSLLSNKRRANFGSYA